MSILMSAERVYSVDVVLQDGTRSVVQIEAASSGEAFRQAKGRSDIRSVGKVTEGVRYEAASPSSPAGGGMVRERRNEHQGRPAQGQSRPAPVKSGESPDQRVQQLGFVIAGPRVVRDSRQVGGERLFSVLAPVVKSVPTSAEPVETAQQPPAPVLKHNPFIIPPKPIAPPAPAKVEAPAAPAEASAAEVSAPSTPVEYRIVKSRRKDGLPYLLQRGNYVMQGTKRVFAADWEKGFDERAKAEKHQSWLEEMARENAELG